jgi:ribosomal protein L25 (general stress protein Ctc)
MKFTAYERTLQGTGASRRLRNAAKVPGIVYGAGTPTMIELDHNALFFALKKEAFHSSILEMELAGKTRRCCCATSRCTPGSRSSCTSTSSASTRPPGCARRCRCTSSRARRTRWR